jgi:hypothetical protein
MAALLKRANVVNVNQVTMRQPNLKSILLVAASFSRYIGKPGLAYYALAFLDLLRLLHNTIRGNTKCD